MSNVLLLNADAQPISMSPLSTISWQNAVKAYFTDKVKIIKSYEDRPLRSENFTMPMPSIVMLTRYHKNPPHAKFTRRNMYTRDRYTCQYCGGSFHYDFLTIDHVIPRSLGGHTSWTNCITACKTCNSKKGSKLIKPLTVPRHPSWYEINFGNSHNLSIPDPAWMDYIRTP
jgi:5-methylcytosine-specific restriction endonuclease McrA